MVRQNKILADLIKRVAKLEHAVFTDGRVKTNTTKQQVFKGATDGLRLLVSNGFFNRKRSFGEIKKTLANNGYHYSKQAVQTPLNALSISGGLLVSYKEKGKKVYAKR